MFLLALSGLVGLAFSRSVPVEEPQQGPAVGEAIDTGNQEFYVLFKEYRMINFAINFPLFG